MKLKTYKTWKYSEHPNQNRVLDKNYDIGVSHDWWDMTYEDAKNIGLKIMGFDIDRGSYCRLGIITSAPQVIKEILDNHGKTCSTYKTAKEFQPEFKRLEEMLDNDDPEFDDQWERVEKEFLQDISEDYLSMLRSEYEYLTSKEAIIEMFEANDYDFNEEGDIC